MPVPVGSDGKEDLDRLIGAGDEYELRAADAPLYNVREPEERACANWRAKCFLDAGAELSAATALAVRRDIDAHVVVRMLERGATSTQVCEIML